MLFEIKVYDKEKVGQEYIYGCAAEQTDTAAL